MSDIVIIAIIQGSFTAAGLLINKKWNIRLSKKVEDKLDDVHSQINGRMSEQMDLIDKSSKARGVLEEKERHENENVK